MRPGWSQVAEMERASSGLLAESQAFDGSWETSKTTYLCPSRNWTCGNDRADAVALRAAEGPSW